MHKNKATLYIIGQNELDFYFTAQSIEFTIKIAYNNYNLRAFKILKNQNLKIISWPCYFQKNTTQVLRHSNNCLAQIQVISLISHTATEQPYCATTNRYLTSSVKKKQLCKVTGTCTACTYVLANGQTMKKITHVAVSIADRIMLG